MSVDIVILHVNRSGAYIHELNIYQRYTTGGEARPEEILMNFRTGVLLPLPVQTLLSKHVFSYICSRKACVLKYQSTCFPIVLVRAISTVAHVTMQNCAHGLFSSRHGLG